MWTKKNIKLSLVVYFVGASCVKWRSFTTAVRMSFTFVSFVKYCKTSTWDAGIVYLEKLSSEISDQREKIGE